MSGDLDRLSLPGYHGYLTKENIAAVAARLGLTLGDRPFVAVETSPHRDGGRPKVHTGCCLDEPIHVRGYEGGKTLVFNRVGGSYSFTTSAQDQGHAHTLDAKDRTFLTFDGPQLTVTQWSQEGPDHYVFAPEGGGE